MNSTDKIRNYIVSNQLEQAIRELHKLREQDGDTILILLSGRLRYNQKNHNSGTISHEEYIKENIQIQMSLIRILDGLKESPDELNSIKMISKRDVHLLNQYLTDEIQPEEKKELEDALNDKEELFAFTQAFNAHNQKVKFQQQLDGIKKQQALKKKWLKVSIVGLGIAASFALVCFLFFRNNPETKNKIMIPSLIAKDSLERKNDSVPIASVTKDNGTSSDKPKIYPLSKKDKIVNNTSEQPNNLKDSVSETTNEIALTPIGIYEGYSIETFKNVEEDFSQGGTRSSSEDNRPNVQNQYFVALDAYKSKNYPSVISALKDLPNNHPNYYSAMELLGRSYFNLRVYSKAEGIFKILYQSGENSNTTDWYLLLTYLAQYPDKKEDFETLKSKILNSSSHKYKSEVMQLVEKLKR